MNRVAAFVARRVVAGIFTLLVMITLTFVVFWAIPNSPQSFVYPFSQHLTNYQVHTANHVLGLDRPKLTQWWDYVSHVARGDFGHAWEGTKINADQSVTQNSIGPGLFKETRVTASLLLGGAALVLLLALPLGAIAARFRNSIGDRLIGFLTLIAICTHPMVVGLLLRTWFADQHQWLPDGRYCTFVKLAPPKPVAGQFQVFTGGGCGGPWPWFEHLILPWISFALLFLALYTRMSRASVLEVLHEDYVRTARSKGASEVRVIGRHVLPNAGIRILTMIGMEIGTAIGIAVYIEAAFGLPGLASDAVRTFAGTAGLDLPVVLSIVTMITLVVIVGNLIVDLVYVLVDPRAGGATMRARRESASTEPVVA
jgi:peptide/nickel transport system permease protein